MKCFRNGARRAGLAIGAMVLDGRRVLGRLAICIRFRNEQMLTCDDLFRDSNEIVYSGWTGLAIRAGQSVTLGNPK
jgi:hypothetical protein